MTGVVTSQEFGTQYSQSVRTTQHITQRSEARSKKEEQKTLLTSINSWIPSSAREKMIRSTPTDSKGNRLRRSLRLKETGYYTEEGKLVISYKEILCRIFRRRRKCHRETNIQANVENNTDVDWYTNDINVDDDLDTQSSCFDTRSHQASTNEIKDTRKIKRKKIPAPSTIMWFLPFLILLFANIFSELREIKEELRSLRKQMDVLLPLVHTKPNFASKSLGAQVVKYLSSDTYWPPGHKEWTWSRLFKWCFSCDKQQKVIEERSQLLPGEGWCFPGDRGHLILSLAAPISITEVTLGHILKSESPNGLIRSAPRKFSIYAMKAANDEGIFLGTMEYNPDDGRFQTFDLHNADDSVFRYVKFQVENNWGNSDYTCIYAFKVHGKPST